MHTSLVLVALALLNSAALESPAWMTDYDLARKTGREEQKPLAVFVSSGTRGWHRVTKEGKLANETARILADDYVCVYVDSDAAWGKRLASALELPDGLGLVISDRTGRLQAYHHVGDVANEDLARNLHRYADAERPVRTTETDSSQHVSYYPPEPPPYYYAPPQSFSFGGGRSC
jgi:hypothetical protein